MSVYSWYVCSWYMYYDMCTFMTCICSSWYMCVFMICAQYMIMYVCVFMVYVLMICELMTRVYVFMICACIHGIYIFMICVYSWCICVCSCVIMTYVFMIYVCFHDMCVHNICVYDMCVHDLCVSRIHAYHSTCMEVSFLLHLSCYRGPNSVFQLGVILPFEPSHPYLIFSLIYD